jgi:hypothetical protein
MRRQTIILAPSLELALAAAPLATLTVEAEYGNTVVEGGAYTAAHHGGKGHITGAHYLGEHEGGDKVAPCIDEGIPLVRWSHGDPCGYFGADYVSAGPILVSHLDLDTLGGIARAVEYRAWGESAPQMVRERGPFWALAAAVDTSGPHRLQECVEAAGASDEDVRAIHAWWAWNQEHRYQVDRDVLNNVGPWVEKALEILRRILLSHDEELLAAGDDWRKEQEALEENSYVGEVEGVLVRSAPAFVNHLYTHEGRTYQGVAALNTDTGAVTISLESPVEGVSCRALVQRLWGPEAGGHDGIAGSPRGEKMEQLVCARAAHALASMLAAAS